jgi:hypothetical protein
MWTDRVRIFVRGTLFLPLMLTARGKNFLTMGGRLHCLIEKENGYEELVVYEMAWK